MAKLRVSSLTIHPLKSARPCFLDQAAVGRLGLEEDRRFMLVQPDGHFVTGRTHPRITRIDCDLDGRFITFSDRGDNPVTLDQGRLDKEYKLVEIFGAQLRAQTCPGELDTWFSGFLGQPVRLVRYGRETQRRIKRFPDKPVAFADGYPLLLISDQSIEDLNDRLPGPVHMGHFRPNITVEGGRPFQEDGWAVIRIGDLVFDLPKPSSRCVFTTVSPSASLKDPGGEPLKTLSRFRRNPDDGEVYVGENMIARGTGIVRVGDEVEVLETKTPPIYPVSQPDRPTRSQWHMAASPAGRWEGYLRCVRVIKETHDVTSFYFVADPLQRFHYLPGQFVTLTLPIAGRKVVRCYTISSSPSRADVLSITVKRVAGGVVSNWLHDHVGVGTALAATGPGGDYHLQAARKNKLILLSAGVGITPMISMARFIADTFAGYDVMFHHSARTARDLIGWREICDIAERAPGISLSLNLTQDTAPADLPHPVFEGRLSADMLDVEDLDSRDAFVCGPAAFMAQTKTLLSDHGLEADSYFDESFGTAPVSIDTAGDREHACRFITSGIKVTINPGQTVLEAAEEAGIDAAFGCRGGSCGACKTRLMEGKVHAPAAATLNELETEQGYILPCCSYALSDLVVDL